MTEQVPSDPLATPKTDALPQPYYNRADAIYELSRDDLVTWQKHARAQERRIAELEKRVHEELATKTALINECMHYRQKLRELSSAATAALTVTKS